jgi:hypothetical protein
VAGNDTSRPTALTGAGDDARAFFPATPLLDALTSTSADGVSRQVLLIDSSEHAFDATVVRNADGELTIALPQHVVLDDAEPLRLVARQLVAVSDTAELLNILTTTAAAQCAATGAAVLKAVANEGELVAAAAAGSRCRAHWRAKSSARATSSQSMTSARRGDRWPKWRRNCASVQCCSLPSSRTK